MKLFPISITLDLSRVASALERTASLNERIAQALERLSPSLPDYGPEPAASSDSPITNSETPEEYEVRQAKEQAFGLHYGAQPGSDKYAELVRWYEADQARMRGLPQPVSMDYGASGNKTGELTGQEELTDEEWRSIFAQAEAKAAAVENARK